MRIVKEAEERKNEILDAASELFGKKGFDGTSTGDILERVGIARGTLYYHFKSKEDIMDALIERFSSRILYAAREIAKDNSIPVVDRIIRVVMALNVSDNGGGEITRHIHKPQNALMHHKTQNVIIGNVPQILEGVIREGVEQGIFNTPFPYECMEMVVTYTNIVFDDDAAIGELTPDVRVARVNALIFNMERLLGAESGSLTRLTAMFGGET